MIIGIVGSEAAKFTKAGEEHARAIIYALLDGNVERVVSGGCHLGGIDIWAIEEAKSQGIVVTEHLPKTRLWEGGYKERNLAIVRDSDVVVCISVDSYPPGYSGMRFPLCYHCKTDDHIKSGGCWTMWRALRMGKQGGLYVAENS